MRASSPFVGIEGITSDMVEVLMEDRKDWMGPSDMTPEERLDEISPDETTEIS